MAFIDRVVEHPGRIKLTPATNAEGSIIENVYDISREEGEVTEEGTPLNAENLNKEIEEAIGNLDDAIKIDPNNNVHVQNIRSGRTRVKTKKKASVTTTVKFNPAFTSTPRMSVTPFASSPQSVSAAIKSVSTTQAVISVYATGAWNISIDWIAIL